MVIVDEKQFMIHPVAPPPPYIASSTSQPPPPFPHHQHRPISTLAALPPHLLLKIVYLTFPQTPGVDEGRVERQRKTLYWLAVGLRLVNKTFYIACMHVLRSTYLPAYDSLIRPPYTSDPFPLSLPSPSHTSFPPTSPSPYSPSPDPHHYQPQNIPLQRETQILDNFIALKVREDVWMDDSELHLEREESFKDLFDLMQPRSRMEDLVRHYGVREGVVCVGPGPVAGGEGTSTTRTPTSSRRSTQSRPRPILFSSLSISFSPRTVGLILSSNGRKRTIVQVARNSRDEKLEYAAKRLVRELGVWLAGEGSGRRS